MEEITVKFTDSELGEELWHISYDEKKHEINKCFDLAMNVLYLPLYESFKELKKEYPELSKKHYDIAVDILDYGNMGVTDDRFCEFLTKAFGFKCERINDDVCIDVEYGKYE